MKPTKAPPHANVFLWNVSVDIVFSLSLAGRLNGDQIRRFNKRLFVSFRSIGWLRFQYQAANHRPIPED
jgi:hypothetical protein